MASLTDYKSAALPTSGGGNPIVSAATWDAVVEAIRGWLENTNANDKGLYALRFWQLKPGPLPTGLTTADAGLFAYDTSGNIQGWNGSGWVAFGNTATSIPTLVAGKYLKTDGTSLSWGDITKILGRDLAATVPTTGQQLTWNGTAWEPLTYALPDIVTASTKGSATKLVSVTYDAKGRVTAASEFDLPQITGPNANFSFSFTNASTVTIPGGTHGLNTARILVQAYDDATPSNALSAPFTVHPSTYDVVVNFGTTVSGRIILNGVGGLGPMSGTPNYEYTFTAATSASISAASHGFTSAALNVKCYTISSGVRTEFTPASVTINESTRQIDIDFGGATLTGVVVVNGTGGSGVGASFSGDATSLQGRSLAATAPTDGQVVTWSSGTNTWYPASISFPTGLPSQTGNSGKWLTTNGSAASWATLPLEIPLQTGHSGKYLTTDGTSVSWATVSGGSGSTIPVPVAGCWAVSTFSQSGSPAVAMGLETKVDLANATQIKLASMFGTNGAVGQTLSVELGGLANTNSGWTATSAVINIAVGNQSSGWVSIPVGVRIDDCTIRLVSSGGNGSSVAVNRLTISVK